jgi:ribosome assembly protein RRB1
MLHRLNVEWPSMSIDFVTRSSPFDTTPVAFQKLEKYPVEVLTVQGSCNGTGKNSLYFTKWSRLHQTKFDDDPDAPENANEEDEDPLLVIQELETPYDVNRIRTLNNSPVVAFWSDTGRGGEVRIVDLSDRLERLHNNISTKKREPCREIVIPCEAAGYALTWNHHKVGELLAGDDRGVVSVFANNENYTYWSTAQKYSYHQGSVEDIVFSPEQSFVFASCTSFFIQALRMVLCK